MSTLHRFICALCLLLCQGLAGSAEPLLLRTLAVDSYPKYVRDVQPHQSAPRGLCADVYALVQQRTGIRIEGHDVFASGRRVETELEAGRIDLFCGWLRSPERVSRFQLIDIPILVLRPVLVIRANDEVSITLHDELHLLTREGSFLTVPGTELERTLRSLPAARIDVSATSIEANLNKLLRGDGRYFFHHDFGAPPTIRRMGIQRQVKVIVLREDHPRPQYIFFSRKAPPELVRQVEAALSAAHQDGSLARLRQRYQGLP